MYRQLSQGLLSILLTMVLGLCMTLIAPGVVQANPVQEPAIEVRVSLGTATNDLKFVPDHLEFQAGKRYKLLLTNPSSMKHYFTAKDFADNIWTQKVEAGQVEIKGAIHELELKPGATAEWVFIPLKSGSYQLRCPIVGHTEAGMRGEVAITG